MKKLRGFALSELLVAVAIAGLIVSLLTLLNVDYLGLTGRVAAMDGDDRLGARAEAAADADRCAQAGAVLTAGENEVVAQGRRAGDTTSVLSLSRDDDGKSELSTGLGGVGTASRPLRLVVETAPVGGSMAVIEAGDATVGVVAPRCDLREVCAFDAANALCAEDETNAADAGNALAGPG